MHYYKWITTKTTDGKIKLYVIINDMSDCDERDGNFAGYWKRRYTVICAKTVSLNRNWQ